MSDPIAFLREFDHMFKTTSPIPTEKSDEAIRVADDYYGQFGENHFLSKMPTLLRNLIDRHNSLYA